MEKLNLILDRLEKIELKLNELQSSLNSQQVTNDWLPRKIVMKFFDYGETAMNELEKREKIPCCQIKHRKFYSRQAIIEILNKNKI
jgi:hypothetical protein